MVTRLTTTRLDRCFPEALLWVAAHVWVHCSFVTGLSAERYSCRATSRIAVDDSNDTASEGFRMTSDGGREEKTEAEYPDHVFCNRNISVIIPRKAGRKAARSLLT